MEGNNPLTFSRLTEQEKEEYWSLLVLRYCHGIGIKTACKLLRFYGKAEIAIQNMDDWHSLGISEKVIQEYKRKNWQPLAEKEFSAAQKLDLSLLLWNNPLYPAQLKDIIDAPSFLYFKGNCDLLSYPAIAIVGTRYPADENQKNASRLGQALSAAGLVVISGMAMGIDAYAHIGALKEIGKSIGVLGTGINQIYPWINRKIFEQMEKEGLLISEFPPNEPPLAKNFPIRNRIISGLSLGVIVVQAAERSGSLITAKTALDQNREIFAIPGRPFNKESLGCQNLIRAGAHPVFDADDILYQLKPLLNNFTNWQEQLKSSLIQVASNGANEGGPLQGSLLDQKNDDNFIGSDVVKNLTEDELSEKIMICLKENGKLQMDRLGILLNVPSETLAPVLVAMEMIGQISRMPGAFYELI